MARVAFMTIGIMHGLEDDPREKGMLDRVDANFAAAAANRGFIWRSEDDPAEGDPWGMRFRPAVFAAEEYAGRLAPTLSLWQDIESVFEFSYQGLHAEALSHRKEWFIKTQWPVYVAWWVEDNHIPTWQEAYARYDRFCREGASPDCFDFKRSFDADGQPVKLDRKSHLH